MPTYCISDTKIPCVSSFYSDYTDSIHYPVEWKDSKLFSFSKANTSFWQLKKRKEDLIFFSSTYYSVSMETGKGKL